MDTAVGRTGLAEASIDALRGALPGSDAVLRGSIADGTDDRWSDIDLRWTVSTDGDRAVELVPEVLRTVLPVESLRLDPETEHDGARRLVFVRFVGRSLFERVDLEVTGQFHVPGASWAPPWSAAESALMNVLAAVKAVHRDRGDVDGLLTRGFERIGAEDTGGGPLVRARALTARAAESDPAQRSLADRVRREVDAAWER